MHQRRIRRAYGRGVRYISEKKITERTAKAEALSCFDTSTFKKIQNMQSKKVTIIDYGCGNILNLIRAIKFIGYEVEVTHEKNKIINSSYLILPGVGAFGNAMKQIEKYNLQDIIL